MSQYHILDTTRNTTSRLAALKAAGIQTIIRYYSRKYHWKVLKSPEAQAISEVGLNIMVVYQDRQNQIGDFNRPAGYRAGVAAWEYARDVIGQPLGSAIYFAVDFNPNSHQVEACIHPYFKGVQDAFRSLSEGGNSYQIGVYGSGLVINTLKNEGMVEFRWLSQSYGFRGTRSAMENKAYEIRQICYEPRVRCETELAGIAIDYDEKRDPSTKIGAFQV